jgi:hypothetical protein
MAKRDTGRKAAAGTDTQDAMNARLAEMAEQLGRMAGRMAAKADAMGDQQALGKQLATMRDNAAGLLAQLRGRAVDAVATAQAAVGAGAAKARKKTAKGTKGAKTAKAAGPVAQGRSGGVVDAPGKKHRTPPPAALGRGAAAGQSARRLAAMPMSKTPRRRGRG